MLVLILQHVSIKQRLTTCSLVSKQFRAAAEAATSRVGFHATSASRMGRFMTWLQTHGTGLTHLDLKSAPSYRLPALPCVRLRSLVLSDMQVQLAPAADSNNAATPAVLDSCRDLTSLSVRNSSVEDTTERLAGLSVLTGLQHFSFRPQQAWAPPGELLSHLLQLTRLEFSLAVSLQHVTCLTDLKALLVRPGPTTTSSELAGVQQLQSITRLDLSCCDAPQAHICASTVPHSAQWTQLLILNTYDCKSVDVAALEPLKNLQELCLMSSGLAPAGVAGTSALLALLPSLTQLALLQLTDTLVACAHPAAYTLLAALKQMVDLVVDLCYVPSGLWQHLARSGPRLWQLRYLSYSAMGQTAKLDADGIRCLAVCCPYLTALQLEEACLPGADLTPLQLLPLEELYVSLPTSSDVGALASCRKLRTLSIHSSTGVLGHTCTALTALTQLTRCEVRREPFGLGRNEPPTLTWITCQQVRLGSFCYTVTVTVTGIAQDSRA